MFGNRTHNMNRGQAMIEFALIILVLLTLIFVMIEGARIFQANLTAQNAARAAGRYATTGQYDSSCLLEDPPCADPRVASIKAVAREELAGLPLDDDAAYEQPGYYLIEVFGTNEDGAQIPDYAGIPGAPVAIRVTFRVGMITPLLRPIAETVRVIGQVVMNNEQYIQVSTSGGNDVPPAITPLPTAGPSPTPTPPDLELTKTDSVDPAIVGEDYQYLLDIINLSETDATNVVLVDELPDEVDYVGDDAGCSYDPGNHEVTCNLGTIAGDGGTSVAITVTPTNMPPSGDTITNNASVTMAETDPDTSNNIASETTQLVANPTEADLVLSKGASSPTVAVADPIVYSISVLNDPSNPAGLADAENVQVIDSLPAEVTFDVASAGCSYDGGAHEVTCDLGTMASGDTASLSIRVIANAEGLGVENYAIVQSTTGDPDPADNADTAVVDIQNEADVGITKSASPNAGVGDPLVYTLNIINNGPADADNVFVQDNLPASVQYNGNSSGCSYDSGLHRVQCSLGTIPDGTGVTVEIYGTPLQEGTVHNVASVTATQADPYLPNNNFDLPTVIHARADVEVTKTGPGTGFAGSTIHYVIDVTNNGPSPATGVLLTDPLPTGMTVVAASASQGTCAPASVVTCGLGTIGVNDTVTVDIYAIPGSGGTYVNTATATATTIDPMPENNSSSWQTVVTATQPYIILDKICGEAGDEITINGFNWPTNNANQYGIALEWLADGTAPPQLLTITSTPSDNPFADDPADWTRTIQIPDAANGGHDGIHEIQAQRRRLVGGSDVQSTDTAEFEIPCPAPNLVISEPVLVSPTSPVVGEQVVFTATIGNIGNLDAVSQFFAGIYFDPTPPPTPGTSTHISQTFRAGLVAINGLAVGASKAVTFTLPSGFSSDGSHTVYAVVDSDPGPMGVIDTEHNETDNISAPITVVVDPLPPGPSPTPTATATPGTPPDPGVLVGQVYFVDNVPQGGVEVNLFNDADGSLVGTTFSNLEGIYNFPSVNPGTYTLTACITIEENGVFHDYYATAAGIIMPPGAVIEQNLYLEQLDGACS